MILLALTRLGIPKQASIPLLSIPAATSSLPPWHTLQLLLLGKAVVHPLSPFSLLFCFFFSFPLHYFFLLEDPVLDEWSCYSLLGFSTCRKLWILLTLCSGGEDRAGRSSSSFTVSWSVCNNRIKFEQGKLSLGASYIFA